ncbi:Alpha/Beta hydrolase protein [Aspergillus pseudodeflectus]|uniref:Alpha/Beta hydrolase protein n=1 Tax=Aspergillus pseudodeflectus TaxID=176178 RepID=A0ABR4KGM9_9EURO
MATNTPSGPSPTAPDGTVGSDVIAIAARGKEITGLEIFNKTADDTAIPMSRVEVLMSQMHADVPSGGTDMNYGTTDSQRLRLWNPKSSTSKAPIIVFVHGGSWRVGTYLDSVGSIKVSHLTRLGYAFATVNYTLFPDVSVAEQVQEVADAVGYLVRNATSLNIDPDRVILMGHSSGAHVVTLLGTDTRYLEHAGVSIDAIHAVIALDGSNYNAPAEILDSPGSVAENMKYALGKDLEVLETMSPTCNARAPNARVFLLLHIQRQGDIRQAVEFVNVLRAAGSEAALHVFEGEGFEGHVQMLLRLGDPGYPATGVLEGWLRVNAPVKQSP